MSAPDIDPAAYRPFRPRRGRVVPLVVGVVSLVVFTVVALTITGSGPGGWQPVDRIMLIAFGALVAFIMWRYASVRAVPSPEGLMVQNLLARRELTWAEVVNVQFGGGTPWAILELADTETLAVMGIQRSDGERAQREAERLAALVEVHTTPERDD